MTKANECTCPSGDGSLRHPCPAHPASVEQAGGDERAVDGKPRATKCPDCGKGDLMPGDLCACGYETDPAAGYACSECDGSGDGYVGEVCRECDGTGWFVTPEQARAALAQPSPAPADEKSGDSILCSGCFAKGVGPEHFDEAGKCLARQQTEPLGAEFAQVLSDNLPELLSTAQAEQAEVERPEVVASSAAADIVGDVCDLDPEDDGPDCVRVNVKDLLRICERHIVGVAQELGNHKARADRFLRLLHDEKKRTDKASSTSYAAGVDDAEHGKVGGKWRTRLFDEATNRANDLGYEGVLDALGDLKKTTQRLHEVAATCATAEQERDAALAEVERLRQFERICEGLPQDAIDGCWTVQGIRGYAKLLEDQLKSALARVAELTATRNRYGVDAHYFNKNLQRILRNFESFTPDELARSLIILAKVADEKVVAQAQHSVPEGFREKFKQCMELAFAEIAYYVSPENARDPNSRARKAGALATELHAMLAAAPGKEVPQAWLDVQVERRRQVEVEGWTPEHDDEHDTGALASAAGCYAMFSLAYPAGDPSRFWPWDKSWWKPSPDGRRNMVKAGALILAEIERLDRAAAAGKEVGHE
ncbi:hypothetical protein L5F59_12170 [Pseudomonas aeruginosa]|nr:hypothetical protein [Pseudomonas aeruginosa]